MDAEVVVDRVEPGIPGPIGWTAYQVRYPLFSGRLSDPMRYEIGSASDTVAALLHHRNSDRVVLVEQFRPGALALEAAGPVSGRPDLLWQTEVVAGTLARGAVPEAAIRQEIEEETGCEITELRSRSVFFANPALMDSRVYLFYAAIRELPTATLRGRQDEGEDIRVLTLSAAEAIARARNGKFHNALTILALSLFANDRAG